MNLRPLSLLLGLLALVPSASAATTVTVADTVVLAGAKRLGMNISFHTYYDSRLMMKELCFRNPGFEGLLFQSVLPVATATANTMTDTNPYTQWTDGYWNGATYEFISGSARGRTGRIASFVAAPDNQLTAGSSYTLADSGALPAAGDLFILRRTANENPQAGWWDTSSNVTFSGETNDLPPDTIGRQALRAVSTTAAGSLRLASNFDTWPNISFIQLNGNYRVTFKAKSRSGANTLAVRIQRGNTALLNQTVTLAATWTTHTLAFRAEETGAARGAVSLSFSAAGQFDLLLDDVSFIQTDSSPGNPTAFRDAVVDALQQFRPAIVRGLQTTLGEQLDNALQPLLARRRSGYTTFGMDDPNMNYNFHEFLELCAHLGAEPWLSFPIVYTDAEMRNFIEYLAGPATSPYGARRAARGQTRPWTEVFAKIHLEFGNESWNATSYLGGAITNPARYGTRGSELFAVARDSPWFAADKFNFILGVHGSETIPAMGTHNASAQHDTLAVDGYFFTRVDNFASNEAIFGSMFAAAEAYNTTLYLGELGRRLRSSTRPVPLAVYEGNLNTTQGEIFSSQSALTAATASIGAGLAVANDYLMRMKLLLMRDQCVFNLGGYVVRGAEPYTSNFAYIWGTTLDMGVTNRKRPTYLATQLANTAIAGDLVRTTHSGDDPTWNQPDMNRIPGGFPNAHYLHSYAFSAAGGQRSLILFNLHRTSALAVNFAGVNAPSGTVTMRRLTSAAITDHNEDLEMVPAPAMQTLSGFSPAQDHTLPPFSMTVLSWNAASSAPGLPAIQLQPQSRTAYPGESVTFTVSATGTPPLTYQWSRNGAALPGATEATLTLPGLRSADAGVYRATVRNAVGSVRSAGAVLGLNAREKIAGSGRLVGSDITHPNGNVYDQVLMTGAEVTVTADPGQVTRTSYIDLDGDIIQLEFAGAGALTLQLEGATGPNPPLKYNQAAVAYMQGRAIVTVGGADETTNVTITSVGRLTAFDPTGNYNVALPASTANDPANNRNPLFVENANYDGIADLALVSISSPTGRFGGLRAAGAEFGRDAGLAGVYAPGVLFSGPLYIHNLSALGDAEPALLTGTVAGEVRVAGGNMFQPNGRSVLIDGIQRIRMTPGTDSHNRPLPARDNRGTYERAGQDVTSTVIGNSGS